MCDAIGRKGTMVVACVLLGISAVFTAIPNYIVTFNIFRIVGGVGVGLCSVASPLYISETAPARLRGALGILYQLAIVLGSVSAPFVSFLIVKWAPHETAWRWMFGSELLPVTIFGGLLLLIPQSPRWLADRGRMDEALEVLTRLEGPESARREMGQIRSALGTESG